MNCNYIHPYKQESQVASGKKAQILPSTSKRTSSCEELWSNTDPSSDSTRPLARAVSASVQTTVCVNNSDVLHALLRLSH